MVTPAESRLGTASGKRPCSRSLSGVSLAAMCPSIIETKLACLDWPPPPSPASASKPLPHRKGAASGGLLGGTGELEPSEAGADTRNRAELWDMRAEIDREKLRMVAPFPFFGCPMRFSDDFAAMQISQDGRFSFSEMSLEAFDPEDSLSRNKVGIVRRVVTYEGVFTGPYSPAPEDDEQVGPRRGSPRKPEALAGVARAKDASTEEPAAVQADPELAAIEATALVKHEIVESGGTSKLVLVERGAFRFAITVSPFFNPTYATVKVLVRCRSPGHPPRRCRRLPYEGTGGPSKSVGATARRSIACGLAAELCPRRKPGGPRLKAGASPFRRAGAGTLQSGGLLGSMSAGHLGSASAYASKRLAGF